MDKSTEDAMLERCNHDIEHLTSSLQAMGTAVLGTVDSATKAFFDLNAELAHTVINNDRIINSYEIEIDTQVLKCLAMKQPTGAVLRLLLAIQRTNNFLERIGDHSVNIAESAIGYFSYAYNQPLVDLPEMAQKARKMLDDALRSFFGEGETDIAERVLLADEAIDKINRETIGLVKKLVKAEQLEIEAALELVRVSKNIERIADLATNIAEEAIFYRQARIVKHHADTAVGAGGGRDEEISVSTGVV